MAVGSSVDVDMVSCSERGWSVVVERVGSVVSERGGLVAWMIQDLIAAEFGHEWLQI